MSQTRVKKLAAQTCQRIETKPEEQERAASEERKRSDNCSAPAKSHRNTVAPPSCARLLPPETAMSCPNSPAQMVSEAQREGALIMSLHQLREY